MIPGLENAEFLRYGVMHRNTFLCSPDLLDEDYSLRQNKNIFFAGQMTGVEGYIESAASGFLAAVEMARRLEGETPVDFPHETAIGALALYITTKVLDLVVYGQNTAKLAYIISDRYEEIMQEMIARDMGATLLNGKGVYTGSDRPLLLCAVRNKEVVSIKRFIKELDPDAFFIVCDASEVLGEGFGVYNPKGL